MRCDGSITRPPRISRRLTLVDLLDQQHLLHLVDFLELHFDDFVGGGLHLAADVAGLDRQFAPAAVDQHKKLHTRRAAVLEQRVDRNALVNPNPGSRPFQRLNRAEYARAVKDMLALDVDVAGLLPADTISHSFDNVADSQAFSTTLMESYLRAAAKITALAIASELLSTKVPGGVDVAEYKRRMTSMQASIDAALAEQEKLF